MSKSRTEVNNYIYDDKGRHTGITAEYVVAHALRQAQRGKKPSIPFEGEQNPQVALQAAVDAQAKSADIAAKVGRDPILRMLDSEFALFGSSWDGMHRFGEI